MRPGFATLFADAGTLWRANVELLLTLAGVFAFLPIFALRLFLPMPQIDATVAEEVWRQLLAWYGANLHWLALATLVQLFGGCAMLSLLIGGGGPTTGEALGRTLRLLPALAIGWAGSALLIGTGLLVFVVPGVYLFGRCMLVLPVLVAEPARGPFMGFLHAMERTRGAGWILAAATAAIWVPAFLIAGIFQPEGGPASPVLAALLSAMVALVGLAAAIAQATLQAAAYRALAAPPSSGM